MCAGVHACIRGHKQIHCDMAVKTLAMAAGICPRNHSHATTIHQRQCLRQHTLAALCRNSDLSIVSILQDLEYTPPPSPPPDVEKNPPWSSYMHRSSSLSIRLANRAPTGLEIIRIGVPRHAKFPLNRTCCQFYHPRTLRERFS